MNRWSMMRGDTTPFAFTVTNDGVPIDLTNTELTWVAKRHYDDADDADSTIIKTLDDGIIIDSAEDGTITIHLEAADTEDIESEWPYWSSGYTYLWNLRVVDDYEQTMTRGRGILLVYRQVAVTS